MKQVLVTIFTCLFVHTAFGQITVMKWDFYPNSELEMTTYENDEEADAVILGKTVKVKAKMKSNNFVIQYDYHYRIKILTKEGLDQADVLIDYYSKKRAEAVTGIKAQTVNIKNGRVEKIKLKKKDIFSDKLNEYASVKKFTFPGAEVGSVLEYKYTLTSDYIIQLDDIYFQDDIPLKWARLDVEVPEFFSYVIIKQATKPFDVETQKAINYDLGPDYKRYQGMRYTWELKDVPALKEEAYITTMDDYRFRVRLQLQSTNYPLKVQNFFSTWDNALKRMEESDNFGRRYKQRESIQKIPCRAVFDKNLSEQEKLEAIYSFVQDNMQWNEKNRVYAVERLNESFKKKTGSSADINLMLLRLLKEAKITAYPVLVSTRSHGKPNPYYPIMKQFNYVLVQAEVDDKTYLLDAVNPGLPMGDISFNCLNQLGWVLKGKSGKWVNIEPASHKEICQIKLQLQENGDVKGEMSTYYDGYAAISMRSEVDEDDGQKFISESIKEDIPDIEVEKANFDNIDKPKERLIEHVTFSVPQMAEVGGDMIYLNPMMARGWEENPFKLKERQYPVDIGFIISEQLIISVLPPKGYVIDEMPKPIKVSLGENGGRFMFVASETPDGSIQIISKLNLKKAIYPAADYEYVKKFFDMVIEKHLLQLVFRKAQP